MTRASAHGGVGQPTSDGHSHPHLTGAHLSLVFVPETQQGGMTIRHSQFLADDFEPLNGQGALPFESRFGLHDPAIIYRIFCRGFKH